MKVKMNRQELAEAMGVISAVAPTRTPKEVLRCALIRAKGDQVELEANDEEVGLRHLVTQVEVDKPGEALVPADKLAALVRETTDEVLVIESDGGMCHVRGAGSHFQICAQDAQEFPAVAAKAEEPDFEIAGTVLRKLIERTMFAAARENTRYAINGVLWEKTAKALRLVATDGRRLAMASGALESGTPQESSAIVPLKAMAVFQRVLGEGDETVGVRLASNQVVLSSARVTVGSVLVEGHFPKYQDVIPRDNDKRAELDVGEMLSAVKQAALLTNEESRGVRFAFSEGELSLTSRAPQEGEALVTRSIRYNGGPLEIGFNPTFVMDVLKVAHVDEVTLELKDSNRPGLVRVGDDFVYVVMPVSLS